MIFRKYLYILLLNIIYYFGPGIKADFSSSFWCQGNSPDTRTCFFKNLCYSSHYESFIFFLSSKSTLSGIDDQNELKEMVRLSTLSGNSSLYLSFTAMPASAVEKFIVEKYFEETTLILHRFEPHNLEYIIHNNLLPIYSTLKQLSVGNVGEIIDMIRIAFSDPVTSAKDSSDKILLYKIFSSFPIIYLNEKLSNESNYEQHEEEHSKFSDKITCFKKSYIGLSMESLWYDFHLNQVLNFVRRENDVNEFQMFLKQNINNNVPARNVIFIFNKIHRLVLNEDEVVSVICKHFEKEFHEECIYQIIYDNNYKIFDTIHYISNTKLLIGMHGSLLSLSIFLPRNSILLEMFPYAIDPNAVTPYKTLIDLLNKNISYIPWKNDFSNNTICHDENSSERGGINHLPIDKQNTIKSITLLPSTSRDNPAYMYRLYQDTIVDTISLIHTLDSGLRHRKMEAYNEFESINWMTIAKVTNLRCKISFSTTGTYNLLISWDSPLNLDYFKEATVEYQVLVIETGSSGTRVPYQHSLSTSVNNVSISNNAFSTNIFDVSVVTILNKSKLDEMRSSESHFLCKNDVRVVKSTRFTNDLRNEL